MIDLHLHTTASDGLLPPAELVGKARAAGLTAIAITDHDTVSGLAEGLTAGAAIGLEVVPGIELSTDHRGNELHLLGYFIDPQNPTLLRELADARAARVERMREILARLQQIGLPLSEDEVTRLGRHGFVGRLHIARAMVERGYVEFPDAAFHRYLGHGRPAFVERRRLPIRDALHLLHQAGGVCSLAHPGIYRYGRVELAELRNLGLDAVEAIHPDHDLSQVKRYRQLAGLLGLAISGGSDYHGATTGPYRELGDVHLPGDILDSLAARRKKA